MVVRENTSGEISLRDKLHFKSEFTSNHFLYSICSVTFTLSYAGMIRIRYKGLYPETSGHTLSNCSPSGYIYLT